MDKDNRKYRFCFIDYMWYVAEIWHERVLKTVDIRSPKTGISVHYSYSLLMAIQIY